MRRFVLWTAGLLGLLLAAFGGLFLLNPLLAGVLVTEVTGGDYGHPKHPPAFTKGMDVASLKANDKAAQNWSLLATRLCPIGSSVEDMQATLSAQGFSIVPARHIASYDWGGMPCLFSVRILWKENSEGRLTAVKGYAGSGCL